MVETMSPSSMLPGDTVPARRFGSYVTVCRRLIDREVKKYVNVARNLRLKNHLTLVFQLMYQLERRF
jgi:hypothetical protein